MRFGFEFLTIMLFVIIMTVLLIPLSISSSSSSSSQRTHVLSVGSFHVDTLQDSFFLKEEVVKVEKISGLDENEEKQGFIVEKFRSLLGLKSFHKRVHSKSNGKEAISPSTAPAPAPAPAEGLHLHSHPHHQKHHLHWKQIPKKVHHEDDRGRRDTRILVAVFVSVGVASLVGAFGLMLFCRKKFTNHKKKKPKRTMPLCSSNGKGTTKGTCYQNSGLDLFYLDALGEDVEQQNACGLKKTSEEIVSVHQEVEMENSDKIVDEDCDSSEDESFHSLVDSQSNLRLSNASVSSLGDTHSMLSPQDSFSLVQNQVPDFPQNSTSNTHEEIETFVQCPKTSTLSTTPPPPPPQTPPPPPPPTPPLKMPLFSLHSSLTSSSSRVSSHSPLSLTSRTLSSPINSETSSRSNQSPQKDPFSPSPPSLTKSPPPPPCPPPFPKGNSNNKAKTPPPPPYEFPPSPLGKDGTPLAKLKPLHWDKVRAAPNRTMVWDKLRSSSFE